MSGWPLLWTVVFFTAVVLFAAVSIVVAVRGFGDVKIMLRRLRDEDES